MMQLRVTARKQVVLITVGSGTWGCGSYTSEGVWFSLQWPDSWVQVHITVKELLPIVLSVAIWGWQWADELVKVRCDNVAAVHILRTGWCKNELAMHLLRSLFFWLARTQVTLRQFTFLGGTMAQPFSFLQ